MAMSQVCRRIVIVGAFSRSPHTGIAVPGTVPVYGSKTPVKRHRGEPGHTRDTRDTRAHAGIRITRTNLTTQRHKPARKPRPTQQPQEQPQARSRPVQYSTGYSVRHRGEPGHSRWTHGTHGSHGSHRRTSQPSHTTIPTVTRPYPDRYCTHDCTCYVTTFFDFRKAIAVQKGNRHRDCFTGKNQVK